jgi:hypothetical protein
MAWNEGKKPQGKEKEEEELQIIIPVWVSKYVENLVKLTLTELTFG